MESVTTENNTIVISTNRKGIKIIRRNYKNRAVVKFSKDGYILSEYRFNNICLESETKYMNWQNLSCCGGWIYSQLDLLDQVKADKKLFTQIIYSENMYQKNEVDKLIEECSKIDSIIIKKVIRDESDDVIDVMLVKKGSVSEYIDVDKVLNDYQKLGVELCEWEKESIKEMADIPMEEYVVPDNTFSYNYFSPNNTIELIFTGMLLGYPVESTVAIITDCAK